MAFTKGLIEDDESFIRSRKTRQLASHSHNEEAAESICTDIVNEYFDVFKQLEIRLEKEKKEFI